MEDIMQWLEAGQAADYQTGVQLLGKHSKNRTLVNHLTRKDSTTNREKLTYELIKLACGGDLAVVAQATKLFDQHLAEQAAVAAVSTETAAAVDGAVPAPEPAALEPAAPEPQHVPEAVREQVDDLTRLMETLYQERCQKSNLLDTASDEAGAVLVADILTLQQQYNALAERRRLLIAGEATGQPAPGTPAPDAQPPAEPAAADVPALAPVNVVALSKDVSNARSNLSKAKGKLARKPDDVALQEKVAKLTIEKEQLELQLKKATE